MFNALSVTSQSLPSISSLSTGVIDLGSGPTTVPAQSNQLSRAQRTCNLQVSVNGTGMQSGASVSMQCTHLDGSTFTLVTTVTYVSVNGLQFTVDTNSVLLAAGDVCQ